MLSLCVSTSFTLWHNIVDKNDTIDKLDEAISLVKPATDLTNDAGRHHAELSISIHLLA